MEEYIGNEEEATPELQIMVMQEEREEIEQPYEARKETEQLVEESRKRKKDTEDAKTEQEEEDDEEDELISNAVYVVMKDTLQKKSFISDRGFNKLISPFREVIEKRGWNLLCEHKLTSFSALVREFHANLVRKKEKTCYVRGIWRSFDRGAINKTYNLKELKDGSKFKKLQKEQEFQKIVELLTDGKGE